MSSFPPPDMAYDVPQPINLTDVYITTIGYIKTEPDVEVLARSGDEFYRFCLLRKSRVVRDFWKSIGVVNVAKLPEGAYQDDRGGCGPYTLTGTLLGEDLTLTEEEGTRQIEPEQIAPEQMSDLLRRFGQPSMEEMIRPEIEPEIAAPTTKVLANVLLESSKPIPSGIVGVGVGGLVAPSRFR